MSEIRNWLETIGLGQYADAFETNDIDMDLIRKIDEEKEALKQEGVTNNALLTCNPYRSYGAASLGGACRLPNSARYNGENL